MGRPKSKKTTAVKESIQETPFEVQTERDEQAAAAAKQPSKLSSKAFFGKDVPQPEPKKALVPLNCINGTRSKSAAPAAKPTHSGAATGATTAADVGRGPQPCRAPVDFLVEERVKRSLEQEPDLAYNAQEVRRLRTAMKTQCKGDWAAMGEEEKSVYMEKAKEDKQRFRTEMRAWREANGVATKADDKVDGDGEDGQEAVQGDAEPAAETADDDKPANSNRRKAAAAPKSKAGKKAPEEARDNAEGATTAPADGEDQPEEAAAASSRPKRGEKKAASVEVSGGNATAKTEKVSRAALRWAEQQRRELLGEGTEANGINDDDEGGEATTSAAAASKGQGEKVVGSGRKASAAQRAAAEGKAAAATQKRTARLRKVVEEEEGVEEEAVSESETENMDEDEGTDMSSSEPEESEEEDCKPAKVAPTKRAARATAAKAAPRERTAAAGAKRGRKAPLKNDDDGEPVQADNEPAAGAQEEKAKSQPSAAAASRGGKNAKAQAGSGTEAAGKPAAAVPKGRTRAPTVKQVEAAEADDDAEEPANTKPASKKARVEDADPESVPNGPAASDGTAGDKPAVQKRGGRSATARGAKAPAPASESVMAEEQTVVGDKKPAAKAAKQGKGTKRAATAPAVDPAVAVEAPLDDAQEGGDAGEQQPEPGKKTAAKIKATAPRGRPKKQRQEEGGEEEQVDTAVATKEAANNDEENEGGKTDKHQPEPEKKTAPKAKAAAPRGRAKMQGKDEQPKDAEGEELVAPAAAAEVPTKNVVDEQQPGAKAAAKAKAAAPRGRPKKQGKEEQPVDAEGEQRVDEEMGDVEPAPAVAKTGRVRGGAAAKKAVPEEGAAKGRPRRGGK